MGKEWAFLESFLNSPEETDAVRGDRCAPARPAEAGLAGAHRSPRTASVSSGEFRKLSRKAHSFPINLARCHQVTWTLAGCRGASINVMSTQFISSSDAPSARIRRRVAEAPPR